MKILPFLFINVTADYWLFLLNRTKLSRSIIAWILAFISICQKLSQNKKKIVKKLLPTLKKAINSSMDAYDTEIMQVIKQLHKSRRELWRLNQTDGGIEKHKKGQHVTSRREQVFY